MRRSETIGERLSVRAKRGLCIAFLSAGAGGCTRGPEYDGCYTEHPAFLVRISAGGQNLPADTRLRVEYGGTSVEERLVLEPAAAPDVVFCTAVPLAGGTDDGDATIGEGGEGEAGAPRRPPVVATVLCELWTQGAATVTVQANGYRPVQEHLKAKRNDCGIETVEWNVPLARPDSGA
jgi:hypothetical protein